MDISLVLFALTLVLTASLGADQCLWGTICVGHIGHVEVTLADDMLKMLAAILTHAETADVSLGIASEGVQRVAVFAYTRGFYVLLPIPGRRWRMLAAFKDELSGVHPEPQKCVVVRRILRLAWVQQRERRNDDFAWIKHGGTSHDVGHRRFA